MKLNWNFKKEQLTVFNVTSRMAIVLSILLVFLTVIIASYSAISMLFAAALCALCLLRVLVPQHQKCWFFSVLGVSVAGFFWWLATALKKADFGYYFYYNHYDYYSVKIFFAPIFFALYATIALLLVAQVLLERMQNPQKRALFSYFGLVVFVGICWGITLYTDIYFYKVYEKIDLQPFVRLVMNVALLFLLGKGIAAQYEGFRLQKRFGRKRWLDILLLIPFVAVVLWKCALVAEDMYENDLFYLLFHSLLQDVTFLSDVCVCTMLIVLGICVFKHLALNNTKRLFLPMLSLPLAFASFAVTLLPSLICVTRLDSDFKSLEYFNRLMYAENRMMFPYSAIVFVLLGVFITLFYYRYYDATKAALWSFSVFTPWLLFTELMFYMEHDISAAKYFFVYTLVFYVPELIFSIVQLIKKLTLIATFDQRVENEKARALEAVQQPDKAK